MNDRIDLDKMSTRAIGALERELGTADALRFLSRLATGLGDYMAERDAILGAMTLDEIFSAIAGPADVAPGSGEEPNPYSPATADPPGV